MIAAASVRRFTRLGEFILLQAPAVFNLWMLLRMKCGLTGRRPKVWQYREALGVQV